MFLLSSIRVMLTESADIDRTTRISLREVSVAGDTHSASLRERIAMTIGTPGFGGRLRRSLSLLPATMQNIRTFSDVAGRLFGRHRDGDQFGAILGGAWSLQSSQIATKAEAKEFFGRFDWTSHREETGNNDSAKVLSAIAASRLFVRTGVERTVSELTRIAAGSHADDVTATEADGVLQRYGLQLIVRHGESLILMARDHRDLVGLLKGHAFQSDIYGQLALIPGAWVSKRGQPFEKMRLAGAAPVRYIQIPIERLLGNDWQGELSGMASNALCKDDNEQDGAKPH
jgi:putative DNA primase/helicase